VDRVNIVDVAEELALKLGGIPGVRAAAWDSDTVTPGKGAAALVSLPEQVNYDATYGRGQDTFTVEFMLLVNRSDMRTATRKVASYARGSGVDSVKVAVDSSDTNEYQSCDDVRVMSCEFDSVQVGATVYLAVIFTASIAGSGE
jgi:hypothetical protein